jgi:hypothetical protein
MRKRIKSIEKKLTLLLQKCRLNDILVPFQEKPCEDTFPINKEEKKENLGAADLFSRFTADIIKEDIVFTR